MKLLPRNSFSIQTTDSIPMVRQKLRAKINNSQPLWMSLQRAGYTGEISDTGFEISRIITSRNSVLTIARGKFVAIPQGTVIEVSIRIHPSVILLCCWLLAVAWFYGLQAGMPGKMAIFVMAMPLVGIISMWLGFSAEVQRQQVELTQIIYSDLDVLEASSRSSAPRIKTKLGTMVLTVGIVTLILTIASKFNPEVPRCKFAPSSSPYCHLAIAYKITDRNAGISALAITPDSKTLISAGADKAIKTWDLATGKLTKTIQSDSGRIWMLAISADGQLVVSGSEDRMIRVWNLATGKRQAILKGHTDTISSLAISLDRQTLVSSSGNSQIKVWDLGTGQLKHNLSIPRSIINFGPIPVEIVNPDLDLVAISLDSRHIFSLDSSHIRTWDLNSGKLQSTSNNTPEIAASIFTGATASGIGSDFNWVEKVNLATGKIPKHLGNYFANIDSSTPARDGRHVIAIDRQNKPVSRLDLKVWNLQTSQLEFSQQTTGSLVGTSPDAKTIVSGAGSAIEIWR